MGWSLKTPRVPDLPSDLAALDANLKLRGAADAATNYSSAFAAGMDSLTAASLSSATLDSLKATALDLSSDLLGGGFRGLFGTSAPMGMDSLSAVLEGSAGGSLDLKLLGGKGEGAGLSKEDAEAREARVNRYREKRKSRKFEKTIRYASRKAYAESRPRVKVRGMVGRTGEETFKKMVCKDARFGIV